MGKKGKLHRTAKPNVEAVVYNNNKKCDWIYTYTYTPISKIEKVQQKLDTINLTGEQKKPKIISTRTKLTKAQTGKAKAKCQLGNKAMKTKLTNMLRGKERKNRYAMLNRGRWWRFIYIKD